MHRSIPAASSSAPPSKVSKQPVSVNVDRAQDVCDCIEEQLQERGPADGAKIDWKDVSRRMREGKSHREVTGTYCKEVWKLVAYGAQAADSDEEDAYMQPLRAVRRFNLNADVTLFPTKPAVPAAPSSSSGSSSASASSTSSNTSSSGGISNAVLTRIVRGSDSHKKSKLVLCRDPREPSIGTMRPLVVAADSVVYRPSNIANSRRKPPSLVYTASFINPSIGERRSAGSKFKGRDEDLEERRKDIKKAKLQQEKKPQSIVVMTTTSTVAPAHAASAAPVS